MGETYAWLFYYLLGFAGLFGLMIGSFLNVVIYRVPAGLSVVSPGSRCPNCETPIAWYDNIPVLSWILLRGRCRHCKVSISPRYALVEALVGVLAMLIWWQVADNLRTAPITATVDYAGIAVVFAFRFALVALLVAITFVDLDHFIIPHSLTVPGMILGLASPWVMQWMFGVPDYLRLWPPVSPLASIVGFFGGALVIVLVFYVYLAARGIEGLGGGDVTLMAMLGAWLGPAGVIFVLFAASVQGLVISLATIALGIDFVTDSREIFDDDLEGEVTDVEVSDVDESDVEDSGGNVSDVEVVEDGVAETDEPDQQDDLENAGPNLGIGEQDIVGTKAEPFGDDVVRNAGDSEVAQQATPGDEMDPDSASPDEPDAGEEAGRAAVPFGPFIALAAIEFLLLGPYLPADLTMRSFNFLF